jgi:hypothetical protein
MQILHNFFNISFYLLEVFFFGALVWKQFQRLS